MIKHKVNYIGLLIGTIIILLAWKGSGDLLNWLYETNTYGFIEGLGAFIANFWLLNILFICLSFWAFLRLLCYVYRTKASICNFTILCSFVCIICNSDDARFGSILLPGLTYQVLWFMMVLVLAIVELSKLLGYYFDEVTEDENIKVKKKLVTSPTSVFFDENEPEMISEDTKLHVDEDFPEDYLGREQEAQMLARYILDNPSYERAIGVAVTGEWGSGKTVFLNYLTDAFKARNIEPMRFDPWQEQSENIAGDFFDLIKKVLDNEGADVTDALTDYLQSLKVTTTNNWFSLTLMTMKHYLNKEPLSVAETKKKLGKLLAKRDLPIVVFIDDCDRLDTESLKQTISLIRTIADLPQLVIVAAYDSKRVDQLLREYGGVDFLKKMFNVTHTLSRIDEKVIQNFIKEQIKYNHKYPIEGFAYPFDNIQLSDYLPTLRDCKIFLNQLQDALVPYSLRKDKYQLDWGALCLLQLLKYHDAYLYERLRTNRLSVLELHRDRDPKDECYVLRQDIGEMDVAKLKLIKKIFEPHISDDYFVIPSSPECFDTFFNPTLSIHWLSGPEFDELVKNPEGRVDRMKSYFAMDDTNFKPLLAESIYNGLQNNEKDAFALLVDAVEAYAQEKKGYVSQHQTQDRKFDIYMEAMKEHLYLGALADHAFSPAQRFGEPSVDIVGDYLKETTYPLAAFALMSDVLSNTTDKFYDDIVMLHFCALMNRVTVEDVDIETRAWICGSIVSPSLYDKFLTAFLDLHFTELIPMTLTFDNGREGYLIAKHDGMKALFDTNERYQKTMARWIEKKAFDAEVLKQHKELVFMTSMLNPKNRERYDARNYPALKPYLRDDDFSCKFEEIKLNCSFWNDKSRIISKDSFEPIMDANK